MSEPFEVEENSPGKELDFELSDQDQAYLNSSIFMSGERKNIEVFYRSREGRPNLRVGPYAGIVQLSKGRIHFSTKVNTRLFYMLSYLKNEDEFLYDPNTPIEMEEGMSFFDIIGKFFLNYLEEILKRGLLKKYVKKKENLRFLRGKISIGDQLRRNSANKSKLFCEYYDLTFDNLENRIILSALNSLISLIRFNVRIRDTLKRYETILKDFITLNKVNPQECSRVRFNRVNNHYEDIIRISQLVLEERYLRSIYKGESRGFNFIVNMNRVYQDFITQAIEDVIRDEFNQLEVVREPRFQSLVKERSIITKPDIVVKKGEKKYPLIIDAKYKKEDPNADYYQVIAYSLALRDSNDVCCLIYPSFEGSRIDTSPLSLVQNLVEENSRVVKLQAKTIDLFLQESEDIGYSDYMKAIKDQAKGILIDLIGDGRDAK